MNSYEQDQDMPLKKRAKVELPLEDYCTKRTNELTQKLEEVARDFPEMKHVLNLSNLFKTIGPTVRKYKQEVEAEKRRLENEDRSGIYKMLPDEMLSRCLSFVGRGHYIFVGSVSKRFRQAYKDVFANEKEEEACRFNQSAEIDNEGFYASDEDSSTDEREGDLSAIKKEGEEVCKTFYQVAASNVSVAKYCFDNQSVAKRRDREKILFHAAMKGRVKIIKSAKHWDILSFWQRIEHSFISPRPPKLKFRIELIAEAGHLNILQCLKDYFDMHLGLYKASRGAVTGGHLHILKWLKEIDCLREGRDDDNLCHFAIASGHVEVLKWLQEQGIPFHRQKQYGRNESELMTMAIKSQNIEMIAYCQQHGLEFRLGWHSKCSIETNNIHVVKYCHENGCEITDATAECAASIANLDIWKYLRSRSIPWHPTTTEYAAALNRFDLLKYAYEDGCEWSPGTWNGCIKEQKSINWDLMNYLYDKKCPWNPSFEISLIQNELDRAKFLNFLVEKKFPWAKKVLLRCIDLNWLEEVKLLIGNIPPGHMKLPGSLSEVVKKTRCCSFPMYQYLFSKGIPFFTGNDKKGFLGRVATEEYEFYDKNPGRIIKWALNNDCPLSESCEFVQIAQSADFRQDIVDILLAKTSPSLDRWYTQTFNPHHYFEVFQKYYDLKLPLNSKLFGLVFHNCIVEASAENSDLTKLLSFLLEIKSPQPSMDDIFQKIDVDSDYSEDEDEVESRYDEWNDEEDVELYHYI
ncbi:hypothetical protein CTEN210_12665 [Chaetoceros tenuissimus]|uniref:Uncharacterized protein n=1 Tax=Chaetoceros tenuissimus TaxID=426638 RepID=A0AAD3D526_9STRA|nr:hypothetical protein CTEN210_12665 [Chaetoceros tenuissimus]